MSQHRRKVHKKNLENGENQKNLIIKLDNLKTNLNHSKSDVASSSKSSTKLIAFSFIVIIGMSGIFFLGTIRDTFRPNNSSPSIVAHLGNFKKDTSMTPLFVGTKLSVIYIGGEFCPFCAMERFAIVLALSEFGTFSNLGKITCSEYGIPTYSFINSHYASETIEFQPVEISDNNGQPLQSMNDLQEGIFNKYNKEGYIPFLCIGGMIFENSAGQSFDTSTLQLFSKLSFAEIQSQIDSKSGSVYNQITAESTLIINIITNMIQEHNKLSSLPR